MTDKGLKMQYPKKKCYRYYKLKNRLTNFAPNIHIQTVFNYMPFR